eukprot:TRINITY_DN26816_c0_g2_i1.p1 TRINITY_DN26816_c0_g2~~TRINITY_DN26816_c0_g2_i1.p1  ORF type:complete len:607 (-),score=110.49 TRINITY_DN26816_c0_g2_i1:414-2234(-)
MVFGIHQLLHAISYFCLGYCSLQDKSPWASWSISAVMCGASVVMLELDLSLTRGEKVCAQVLTAVGPVCATVCTCIWQLGLRPYDRVIPWLLSVAFAAHACELYNALKLCGAEERDDGAVVPVKFRFVVHLDVFGWLSKPAPSRGMSRLMQQDAFDAAPEVDEAHVMGLDETGLLGACGADPRPKQERVRIDSVASEVEDAFDIAGTFPNAGEVMPKHETLQPGRVPWIVFRFATWMLMILWVAGMVLPFGFVSVIFRYDDVSFAAVAEQVSTYSKRSTEAPSLAPGERVQVGWPSQLAFQPTALSCDSSGEHLVVADDFGVYTAHLSADLGAEGSAAEALLGLRGASASARKEQELFAQFRRTPLCQALQGDAVEDVTLMCPPNPGSACYAIVLHNRGRRLSTCRLTDVDEGSLLAETAEMAAASGLPQRLRDRGDATWKIPESWLEKRNDYVESVAIDAGCQGLGTSFAPDRVGCVIVGTRSGRLVQLRKSLVDNRTLVPERMMQQRFRSSVDHGTLHVFGNGFAAALRPLSGSIQAFDLEHSAFIGEWRLPSDLQWKMLCGGGDSFFVLGYKQTTAEGAPAGAAQIWRFRQPSALDTSAGLPP